MRMHISCLYQANMFCFFFFNDSAATEIYTLSLHDALPISSCLPISPSSKSRFQSRSPSITFPASFRNSLWRLQLYGTRSEEHTSELQSRQYLVCRLLLEKKKKKKQSIS